jgi:hypothetical protein
VKCQDCSEHLAELIFGELSFEKELTLHEHLAECDNCREEYISLSSVNTDLDLALNDNVTVLGLGEERLSNIKAVLEAGMPQSVSVRPLKKNIIPFIITVLAACILIAFIFPGNNVSKEDVAKNSVMPIGEKKVKLQEMVVQRKPKKMNVQAKEMVASDQVLAPAALFEDSPPESKDVVQSKVISSKVEGVRMRSSKMAEISSRAAMVVPFNTHSLNNYLKRWQQKNQGDPKVQKIVSYLSHLKAGSISLKPAKVESAKTSTVYRVIIYDKAQKPIEYGLISIHNGNIASFEELVKSNK